MFLKEIRKAKKITAEKLAADTGLAKTTIWNYESGRREPDIDTLVRLADALGVSLDMLIRGKEKELPPENREQLNKVGMEAIDSLPPQSREIALALLAVLQPPTKK